jgi:MFS family permease
VVLAILVMPTLGWRWLLGLSSLPLLVFFMFCYWLPESARFDLTSGRPEKALKTLEQISSDNKAPLPAGSLGLVKQQKRGEFITLLSPEHRRTTLTLWFIWFANAFSYYGIVLLTTEMFQSGNACKISDAKAEQIKPFCYLKCLQAEDYVDVLKTTVAEFPGILITVILIELVGRKLTIAIEYFIFGVFVLLLNFCVSRSVMIFFYIRSKMFYIWRVSVNIRLYARVLSNKY